MHVQMSAFSKDTTEYNLLRDLNDTNKNWRIKAKIMHMWNAEDPVTREFKSIDMILQGHNVSIFKYMKSTSNTLSITNIHIFPYVTGRYNSCKSGSIFSSSI